MATTQRAGIHFNVDGNTIDFFGAKGMRMAGDRWAINISGSLMAEVDPFSMMEDIRGRIKQDVAAGNEDKVAQIQLGPRQAVVFFLEGKITRDHLDAVVEGPDFIDIPNVEVDGKTYIVRVLEDPEQRVATANAEGAVL